MSEPGNKVFYSGQKAGSPLYITIISLFLLLIIYNHNHNLGNISSIPKSKGSSPVKDRCFKT